jgi:hypothetical protein
MNPLRLLDLDGFENIYIGYVLYGMWTPGEFREIHRVKYGVSGKLIDAERLPHRFGCASALHSEDGARGGK